MFWVSDIHLNDLFDTIIDDCRETALNFGRFIDGDGAIRITFIPRGKLGFDLTQVISRRANRIEAVAKIQDGGNFVLNRPTEPIDSYGTSALNVAEYLREAIENNQPIEDASRGFGSAQGVISFDLLFDCEVFGLLLVCVDGATPEENGIVANSAKNSVCNWCRRGPQTDGRTRLFYSIN